MFDGTWTQQTQPARDCVAFAQTCSEACAQFEVSKHSIAFERNPQLEKTKRKKALYTLKLIFSGAITPPALENCWEWTAEQAKTCFQHSLRKYGMQDVYSKPSHTLEKAIFGKFS